MSIIDVVRCHSVAPYRNTQTSYAKDSFIKHAGFSNVDISVDKTENNGEEIKYKTEPNQYSTATAIQLLAG